MAHMPSSGVSGVDLYVRVADKLRFVKCGVPVGQENEMVLWNGGPNVPKDVMRQVGTCVVVCWHWEQSLSRARCQFALYLPLYNGVTSLELGVERGSASLLPGPPRPPRSQRPIVFYGTSITHGEPL